MSNGGGMPTAQPTSPATGATGASPTTSQQMQAYQSPAGGKGGYPAQQQVNPFASQYQQPQQFGFNQNTSEMRPYRLRAMGLSEMNPQGQLVQPQPTMRQRYGNPFSDNVFADEVGRMPTPLQDPMSGASMPRTLGPESLMGGYRQPISPEIPLQSSGIAGLMGGLERPQEQKIYPQVLPPEPKPE